VEDNKNKFAEKLKKDKVRKLKNYEVIVCVIDNDCLLKSHKPLFIY
jgi:pyruvate kinase